MNNKLLSLNSVSKEIHHLIKIEGLKYQQNVDCNDKERKKFEVNLAVFTFSGGFNSPINVDLK